MKSRIKTTPVQKAFKSYANSLTLVNEQYTGESGLSYIQFQKNRFEQFLAENRHMKLNIKAEGLFVKYDKDTGETVELLQNLPATRFDIYNEDDLVSALENSAKQILLGIGNMELRASNFQFLKITTITFHYDRYDPTRAGSYILLPEPIKNKKACINTQNEGNKCFKYCVQCHAFKIYEKKNSDRMSHYKDLQDDVFDWRDVKFPVGNNEIGRFEQNNKGLIAINVFEPDDVFNAKDNIDLLRIYDENGKYHHVYVKSKSRLLNKQYNKDGHQKEFCHYCHQAFGSKRVLEKHLEKGCLAVDGQKFTLPEKGSYIEFDRRNTKLKCPYVIYGDFECLTTKSEQNQGLIYA